ncbi:MAG: preprotein translocase subunit SecE [Planctomycetes bacterium]|nr:preprotein translocase subunit SecE [Planctomycetota bacterium]
MALFESYRRGAGRKTRGFATALLLLLLAWMSYAFLNYGNTRLDRLLQFEDPFFGKQLVQGGGALTEWVTWSMFIALGMFIVGLVALRAWLNRPRFADLLIETEAELRRVRWAPRKETNRATGVVLYFVLWFAIFMFVYDLTFTMGIGMLQGQKWSEVGWGRIATMVFRLDPTDEADKAEGK